MDKFNKTLAGAEPIVLSIFRFMVGLLLFQYGVKKMLGFPPIPANAPAAFLNKVELMSLGGIAGVLKLLLGGLLLIGLFTRPAAFVLSGLMAFAYFIGHMFQGGMGSPAFIPLLNRGNAAILFCFACLYISAVGGGPWSLDAMMRKK